MRTRLINWIAVLLLVFGQVSLLAHAADIDMHQEHADDCAVCLVAQGTDDVLIAANSLLFALWQTEAPVYPYQSARVSVSISRACIRAPPAPLA
jgi:hypothetical protein